jgi:hypothetical protein
VEEEQITFELAVTFMINRELLPKHPSAHHCHLFRSLEARDFNSTSLLCSVWEFLWEKEKLYFKIKVNSVSVISVSLPSFQRKHPEIVLFY